MTLILLFIIGSYGAMKSIELITYDETDIMVSQRDAYFNSSYVLDNDKMWYAFGLSAYDSDPESIEDESYGMLKPSYESWGLDNEEFFQPIPTRPCTKAELHVGNETDPNSKFFKPSEVYKQDLNTYWKKLKCLDVDKLQIQGDYNSPSARQFVLLFERCDNKTFNGECKTDL